MQTGTKSSMKKVLTLLALTLLSSKSLASCNFSSDIKENSNGTYTYSKECHIEVGKAVRSVPLLEEKTTNLEKRIEIKDLMIQRYEERAQLWMDTSMKLNDKLQTYDRLSSKEKWTSFALGVGVTILSVWAAGQVSK